MFGITTTRKGLALVLLFLVAIPGTASAAEFFLRAEATTITLPNGTPGGRQVTVWSFALDSSFGGGDGTLTVPGPMLTVPPGDTALTIHLDNNLTVPISIVIPGQNATMVPVRHTATAGPEAVYLNRVRSLTHETPPGNTEPVTYTWTNFRAGTFIYHSGTHPALQVQMGLYGGIKKDVAAGTAYAGVPYDSEVVLFFSEIDPDFHDVVAGGNYGPAGTVTSPIDHSPKYFLINGAPYTQASTPLPAVSGANGVLIRFLNAGLRTHAPLTQGLHMSILAEDGFPYSHQPERYCLTLPALKTKDAIFVPTPGTYAVYDRALYLTNGAAAPGGMLTYIEVTAP